MNTVPTEDDEATSATPKRKFWSTRRWVILAVGIAVVIGIASQGHSSTGGSNGPLYDPSVGHTVTYMTGGTARYGDITMQTPTGTSQASDVDIPLKMKTDATALGETFTGFSKGDFVYLSVQNGQDSGTVQCSIEVDGVLVSSNTGQGAYAIATCEGRA